MQGRASPNMESSFFDCATILCILWFCMTVLKESILQSTCFHLKNKGYLLIIISPDLKPVSASTGAHLYSKERKQNQSPDVLELHLSFAFWKARTPGVYTLC